MKPVLIVFFFIVLFVGGMALQGVNTVQAEPPKPVTIVKIFITGSSTAKDVQDFILKKSFEGYKVVILTAYANSKTVDDFILVMEK